MWLNQKKFSSQNASYCIVLVIFQSQSYLLDHTKKELFENVCVFDVLELRLTLTGHLTFRHNLFELLYGVSASHWQGTNLYQATFLVQVILSFLSKKGKFISNKCKKLPKVFQVGSSKSFLHDRILATKQETCNSDLLWLLLL